MGDFVRNLQEELAQQSFFSKDNAGFETAGFG
jgi:hypothetical protein